MIIVFLSVYPFSPDSDIPYIAIPGFDKIVHFFFYFTFSVLLIFDLNEKTDLKKPRRFYIFSVFLCSFIIGGALELIQHFLIPERTGSWYDMCANALGSITGIVLYYRFPICAKFLRHF
jgi:VanZ family protein